MAAVLYLRDRSIEAYKRLKNINIKPGSFECEWDEYERAKATAPKWATSTIFFHSHPIINWPSCGDVRGAPRNGFNIIFDCPGGTFNLYQYPRVIRQEASTRKDWGNKDVMLKKCRLPLYVETGILSLDSTILHGRKHKNLLPNLRKHMYQYWQETLRLIDSRGSEFSPPINYRIRESRLGRFFDGLEYYIQFKNSKKPKRLLNVLEIMKGIS